MRTSMHQVLQATTFEKHRHKKKALLGEPRKPSQMVQVTHCVSPVCFNLQGANLGGVSKWFSPILGCFSFLPQVPSHCCLWWVHSPWTGFASASSLCIWKALAAFSLACVCENVVTADSSLKIEIMCPAGPEASFALRYYKNSISFGSKGCTVFWNPITNTWGLLSSGGLSCGINPQWVWNPPSCFHI